MDESGKPTKLWYLGHGKEAVCEPFLRRLEDNKEDLTLTRVEPSQEGTLLMLSPRKGAWLAGDRVEGDFSVYTCVPFENQEGKVNGYFF